MRLAYFHGFASSAHSTKGVYLQKAFLAKGGPVINLLELNVPSFSELTCTGALRVMDELAEKEEKTKWCLLGSSMGGFLAARWASLHPERVNKLVLLCPGFNLVERWPAMLGESKLREWQSKGSLPFPDADGKSTPVHFAFYADVQSHPPFPNVQNTPVLIVHGSKDVVVPISSSREFCKRTRSCKLIEVDDDHALTKPETLKRIESEAWNFLELGFVAKSG